MTPVRALFASLIAAILLGAGAFIAASFAGGRPHELVPLLDVSRTPFSLWCFLAAWGAIVFGALGVIAAFLAFIAPEDDDERHFRRHGFPKAAPLVLIALSLGLVWFALRCCGAATAPPIAIPVEPSREIAPNDEPQDVKPSVDPVTTEIAPIAAETSFAWRYKDPLLRGDSIFWSSEATPFSDNVENESLLCGRAWVAVTGSASEEGPPARNASRATLRAKRAMARVSRWLADNPECGPTIVLGVDLGQHAPITNTDDNGVATAYQRQTLIVGRARRLADERVTAAEAEAEVRAFLADPASRAALYGPRIFPAEPEIISPSADWLKAAIDPI